MTDTPACASASTRAARSPTWSPSTSRRVSWSPPRRRRRRAIRPTASWPASTRSSGCSGCRRAAATRSPRSATAPRSPPTSCSRARSTRLGFITTEGYEFVLEIARQSVPDGYGNSYFWVKPERIVPRDLVRTVGGRLAYTGDEIRPLDEDGVREVARWFRDRGVQTVGICLVHAYANPAHEQRVRDDPRRGAPGRRRLGLARGAARVPRVRTVDDHAGRRRGEAAGLGATSRPSSSGWTPSPASARVPFYVMKSNGGVLSADEVVHQPITTVLSGPAAGALGAALIAQAAGFDRVVTCDGGGTSTDVTVVIDGEPTLTTEGTVGVYPSKIPMIDVVTVGAGGGSIAWMSPEGTLKVGPARGRRPGPDLLRQGRRGRRRSPMRTCCSGGSRRTCSAARCRSTSTRPARAWTALAATLGLTRGAGGDRRAGDLRVEPGQRAAPDHRQARPRRPRLHADDVRRLGLAAAVPAGRRARPARGAGAAQPRQRVRVRPAHRRRQERLRPDLRRPARRARPRRRGRGCTASSPHGPRPHSTREGFPADEQRVRPHRRPALLRPGLRGAGAVPDGRSMDAALLDSVAATRSTPSTGRSTATTSPATTTPGGRVGQPAGVRHRADPNGPRSAAQATSPRSGTPEPATTRQVCFDAADGYVPTAGAPALRPASRARRRGPRDHRGVRLDRAAAPGLRRPRWTRTSTSSSTRDGRP